MTLDPNQLSALSAQFDRPTWRRGMDYARQGRVVEISRGLDESDQGLTARVQGTELDPYVVTLDLGADVLEAECSCPVGFACKHAAAVVFALLSETGLPRDVDRDQDAERESGRAADRELTAEPAPGVRREVQRWLDDQTRKPVEADEPSQPTTPLLFCLDFEELGHGIYVPLLEARRVQRGKRGGWTKGKLIPFEGGRYTELPDEEHVLLGRIRATCLEPRDDADLRRRGGADLLQELIAASRVFLDRPDDALLLRLGPARTFMPRWQLNDSGAQILGLGEPHELVLLTNPVLYIDVVSCECGLVSGFDTAGLESIAMSPVVEPDEVDIVRATLGRAGSRLPLPRPVEIRDVPAPTPRPVLRLSGTQMFVPDKRGRPAYTEAVTARVQFAYGSMELDANDSRMVIRERRDDIWLRFPRDGSEEKRRLAELAGAGLARSPTWGYATVADGRDPYYWEHLARLPEAARQEEFERGVDALRVSGWTVLVGERCPYKEELDPDAWYLELAHLPRGSAPTDAGDRTGAREDDSDSPWFNIELGIEVGGQRLSLLPALTRALRALGGTAGDAPIHKLADLPLELADGRKVVIPEDRLTQLVGPLLAVLQRDKSGTAAKVDVFTAAALVEGAQGKWQIPAAMKKELRGTVLALTDPTAARPPKGLRAELRDYQLQGLGWLQTLAARRLGGILADDMGLGKTIQAIAHLLIEVEAGRATAPSLIVAPTSVVPNWVSELERFAPSLRVVVLHGSHRAAAFAALDDAQVAITTYPLLHRDRDKLIGRRYHLLILDEAQNLKNPGTHAHDVVGSVEAEHRVCLTGTPIENHLGELWAEMAIVMPGFLGSHRDFSRRIRTPIEKEGDRDLAMTLARRVRPFILRRTKEQVAKELPPRTEIVQRCELAGAQRDLYETLRLSMHKRVRQEVARLGVKRAGLVILEALLKLRQVCCDPRLTKIAKADEAPSAKLELLFELLPSLLEDGRRILLFSQFTSMLELISAALNERGLPYVTLTGDTTDRKTPVARFQRGEVPLFLLSLKAGGTGLNLTAADTVIHYDPWWNPAAEQQATDRAHRIGQDKPVFIYKLIASGTVEERMLQLQDKKRSIAKAVVGGGDGSFANVMSESEIERLFAPL